MKLALVAVIFACAIGYISADCSALERFKVKHQWQEAFGTGAHRIDFGIKFFNNVFKDYPGARALFTRVRGDNVYSTEFEAHAERVLSGLDMTISLLDDESAFKAQQAHLKAQHIERKIEAKYFDVFRDELLRTLPAYLGSRLDWDAWNHCFNYITDGIKA
jgi:hemoglobin-like flavoprotein